MLNLFFLKNCVGFLIFGCVGSSLPHSGFESWACSPVVQRRLTEVASLVEQRLQGTWALEVGVHRPSCSLACGIFPDEGLNLCPIALAVKFLTTEPLRNSAHFLI